MEIRRDHFRLAFVSLKHRGVRSWLTLLGIFIGVLAVVSLVSLGNGLKTAVSSQFGISNTEMLAVRAGGISSAGPPGTGVSKPLTIDDAKAIEKLSSVESAIPRIVSSVKLKYKNNVKFSVVASMPSGEKRDLVQELLELKIEKGRFLKDEDYNEVMLGYNFYGKKGGFDEPVVPGKSLVIQDKKFKVVGILKKKGSFIFDNAVYMNEGVMRDLLNYSNKVDIIAVKVREKDLMEKAKKDIEKIMRARRNVKIGQEDFEVSSPQSTMDTINNILSGVQIFIIIVASISILVGSIGITNTMTTSVLERKKEIGIMKSIGARNSEIFLLFLIESGLLGFVGGVLGVLGGLGIGYAGIRGLNSFLGSEVSLDINLVFIFFVLLGSFAIGAVSGILPALNASRQNPVEAIRE